MSSELFEFMWRVPLHGFEWRDGKRATDEDGRLEHPDESRPARVLVEQASQAFHYQRYYPLRDHPALFRTFADVEPSEEALCAFANRYGPLGREEIVSVKLPDQDHEVGTTGETLDFWLEALQELKEAVKLWGLLREDRLTMRQRIHWKQDSRGRLRVEYCPGGGGSTLITSSEFHPEWQDWIKMGDAATAATALLLRWVNEHIENQVPIRLLYHLQHGEAVLRMVPHSLLGCLWLELAEAISGSKTQRQCQGCKQWFEVSAYGSRSDRQFCSQACRNRVYRQRVVQAQQMHQAGKKPKEIATSLQVELASVKKWIAR